MTRWFSVLGLLLSMPLAQACGLDGAAMKSVGDGLSMFYRHQPLAVAQPVVFEFRFCRGAKPWQPSRFKLDAVMPAHGHGMNYRARISPAGAGAYHVDGLLFHMPGLWRVVVEFADDDRSERIELDYRI